MNKYLGIVDADSIVYRVAATTEDEDTEVAQYTLDAFLYTSIKSTTRCDKYILVISGGRSGRDQIAVTKPYKGNRKKSKPPKHLHSLFEYLEDEYSALKVDNYEADDVVTAIHDLYKSDSILIGIDKDNLQSYGTHFNYVKDEVFEVTQEHSEFLLAKQMLMGDSSDNIIGLPKIGEKTAIKILNESSKPYMTTVWEKYREKGFNSNYFIEQLKLLKMQKDIFIPYELFFIELPEMDMNADVETEFSEF